MFITELSWPVCVAVLSSSMQASQSRRATSEGVTWLAPWANLGLGFAAYILKAASQAKAPRQTIAFTVGSSSSSRMAYGRQASRSSGEGLFCGGAQRTAAEIQSP